LSSPHARRLVILCAVAVWSILPPYVGPWLGLDLDVSSTVEAIDHLIPGLVALGGAIAALALARRGRADSGAAFAGLAAGALTGLFQTVTHITLVQNAGGPQAPVDAVVLHASPGPVLVGLSLWLLLVAPVAEPAPSPPVT
jgi:hypothetical protein